ncbi:protein [Escherichia coli]|uniref:Protein n=1 Tax=Escherichia coli TaxID=562 RepID=A0AB38GTM3_ECOLX|nr:protein [Escherichia coli]
MKKFALLAGLFVFAPMTWAQDYNIKNGLPSETYITCAEANEMAKLTAHRLQKLLR